MSYILLYGPVPKAIPIEFVGKNKELALIFVVKIFTDKFEILVLQLPTLVLRVVRKFPIEVDKFIVNVFRFDILVLQFPTELLKFVIEVFNNVDRLDILVFVIKLPAVNIPKL